MKKEKFWEGDEGDKEMKDIKNMDVLRDRFQKNYIIAIILLIVASFISLFTTFSTYNSGDAAIYLVFAKYMQNGLFYYGYHGPVGGATSPLWALMLSIFYLFDENPIFYIKLLCLVIYFLIGISIYYLSKKIFDNFNISILTAAIWFLLPMGRYYATVPYETILGVFVIILFLFYMYKIYLSITNDLTNLKDFLIFGVLTGLLPLIRPDSVILIFLSYALLFYILVRSKQLYIFKFLISSILLSLLVSMPYYIFLFINTGELIPSSLMARGFYYPFRLAHLNTIEKVIVIFKDLFFIPKNLAQNAHLFILLFLSIPAIKKYKKNLFIVFLFVSSTIFTAFYLIRYPWHDFDRYTFLIVPNLVILSSFSIYTFIKDYISFKDDMRKIIYLLLVISIILLTIFSGFLQQKIYPTDTSNIDAIFEKNTAEYINSISNKNDVVLVREIQVQYYLNIQAISADGIVGGEILPYLKDKNKDMERFFIENNITMIWGTEYNNPNLKEYEGTLLYEFANRAESSSNSEEFEIGNITFKKIKGDIYRIEYNAQK
ncbi:hypothetical protein CW713_11270 [Methanophagales archaeon]|nr:MAG: hypothetical protein CW713_11270 [Methanophagales archaeon]